MQKLLLALIGMLFIVIIILAAYVYGFPSFSPKQQENQQNETNTSQQTVLINLSAPKTFDNPTPHWVTHEIPKSTMQILHPLQINVTLSVKVAKDAPQNTSAGIIVGNKLEEKDSNARRVSLYYYLKNKQWILKYQAGEISKYYDVFSVSPEHAKGNFSLLISSDGTNVMVTTPNNRKKTIYFPDTLYDTTNQMMIKILSGPESIITVSDLSYKQISTN